MTTIIHHELSHTPVPINDRCFNYGDGCFTTILSQYKRLLYQSYHLKRLKRAASVLALGHIDWDKLMHTLSDMVTEEASVIKVLISRGAGGRGYSGDNLSPFIYITTAAYPPFYADWRENGIELGISPVKLGLNPLLAGIKHCNRLEQVLIKQAIQKQPSEDAVVCDLNGVVVECSASNVFWRKDQQWYTPTIDTAGVDGVMKQYLIDNLAELKQTDEVKQPIADLFQANSVFICNSLMGIVPVHGLNSEAQSYHYDIGLSGDLSRQLSQQIERGGYER